MATKWPTINVTITNDNKKCKTNIDNLDEISKVLNIPSEIASRSSSSWGQVLPVPMPLHL